MVQDRELLAPYLQQAPPTNRDAVFQALEDVVVPPVIARFNELTDRINAQLELAVAGRLTPRQALSAAQAAARDPID
ncbi:hypothetical protein [Limnochorda pilosa]|uniref:Sugar ABC transporter sugar-binding protein n=1 Tax=Limnochorda pilosa TaxID=1555112 RepID=A0A0K2SL91_LIMPI|nr:hypothetical protein [Limnochorda pilosa]BAS27870.1 sugar ABC transporter sugar-binding protein [Limnochorda pilosa]